MKLPLIALVAMLAMTSCKKKTDSTANDQPNESGETNPDSGAPDTSEQWAESKSIDIETKKNMNLTLDLKIYNNTSDDASYEIVTPPQNGKASFQEGSKNVIVYTPNSGYTGKDKFSYKGSGAPDEEIGEVNINITNATPVAQDVTIKTKVNTKVSATLIGSDPDGDTISFHIMQPASNGEVTNLDASHGTLDYTPKKDFIGTDTIGYRVKDPYSTSPTSKLIIEVVAQANEPGDDIPENPELVVSIPKNQAKQIDLSAKHEKKENLTYEILSQPKKGKISEFDPKTGLLTYTPGKDQTEPDFFTYSSSDGGSYKHQGLIRIEIVNSIPYFVSNPPTQHSPHFEVKDTRNMPVILRDFKDSHPDFENRNPGAVRLNMVKPELGDSDVPEYIGKDHWGGVENAETFSQWYRDLPDVNCKQNDKLPLKRVDDTDVFSYTNESFFPLDNKCFGNQGRPHNYHFTLQLTSTFVYRGNETFTFVGDDDMWVYINRKQVIDLGGVHSRATQTIHLADIASKIGIQPGKSYSFHLFFAERHTHASRFRIDTTIELKPCIPYVYQAYAEDPNGDKVTYSLVKGPKGMYVEPNLGIVHWMPYEGQTGQEYEVIIKADDGYGGTSEQKFTIKLI